MVDNKSLAIKGVFWTGLQMVVNQGFAFVIRLILAKLLFPEQFGLIGMATVFIGFVQVLNDLGIAAALVQKKDKDLRDEHYHTAFWVGVIWSVVLFILMSTLISQLAAEFYHEPLLLKLIPVLSLGILSSPVNLVHKAQLTKKMEFKKIAFIDNTSNIISGVISLMLAFLGAGVWSLAFNSVASILIAMPLYFRATGWYPKFIWDKDSFQDVFGFGIYTTATSIINYLINNIDYLLIGKLLSKSALGSYTLAFVLTDTFRSRMMAVINNVMYPLYGRKQDDPVALKNYYLKVVNYNSILIYPIMLFMFTLGGPFVRSFFGEKWDDSITPLQILALSVMFHMLVNSNTALIRGMGRPQLELKLQLFKAMIFIPTLIAGIYYYGISGAAMAILINKIFAVIIAQFSLNKLLNIKLSYLDFLIAIKEPWIASIVSFAITYFCFNVLQLHYIICTVILFASYGFVIWSLIGSELKKQFLEFKKGKKNISVV